MGGFVEHESRSVSTADLYDENADRVEVCDLQFITFGRWRRFCGPCVTVRSVEDHRPVLAVLNGAGQGRVLVVDSAGSLRVGVLGDRLACLAARNGWAGVVVHGAIRDADVIDTLEFGVKALGTTARRARQPNDQRAGCGGLTFGGAHFQRGDWVYADRDAVIVSRLELAL